METENEINHEYTDEIVCPHCGYEFGDSWEFPESGDYKCPDCDNKFKFQREIEVTYSTEKI